MQDVPTEAITRAPVDRRGLLQRAAAGLAVAAGGAMFAAREHAGDAAPAAAATFGDVVTGRGPFGIRVVNSSPALAASGIRAELTAKTPGANAAAIRGVVVSGDGEGSAVAGQHRGVGRGVFGESVEGPGVEGFSKEGIAGVLGTTADANGTGVRGDADGANSAGVFGRSPTGRGVWGRTTSGPAGVYGETSSDDTTAGGVVGQSTGRAPGVLGQSSGGRGISGRSENSYGVYGRSQNGSAGVYGFNTRADGYGVSGWASGAKGAGVFGTNPSGPGVLGTTGSKSAGVAGVNESGGYGVSGTATGGGGRGVYGFTTNGEAGVYGGTLNVVGSGVYGLAFGAGAAGVYGKNTLGAGVWGYTPAPASGVYGESGGDGGNGLRGVATAANGRGVLGVATAGFAGVEGRSPHIGVEGITSGTTINDMGIHGLAPNNTAWAGYFDGKVGATGTYSGASATTAIDHPLDPANRTLRHAHIASPEMKNVYDGVITTDSTGRATVTLPAYVEALNRSFRYQLTVIGGLALAVVSREIGDGRFEVTTDKPSVKVSWQITGIRRDAYATRHGLVVEEDKLGEDRGHYLHPEEHGQPAAAAIALHRAGASG